MKVYDNRKNQTDDREWAYAVGTVIRAIEELHQCQVTVLITGEAGSKNGFLQVIAHAQRMSPAGGLSGIAQLEYATREIYPQNNLRDFLAVVYKALQSLDHTLSKEVWAQERFDGTGVGSGEDGA
jgi:hypothetical protein